MALITAYATPKKWDQKRSGHAKFRKELSIALIRRFDKSKERKKPDTSERRTRAAIHINQLSVFPKSCNGKLVKSGGQKECMVCKAERNSVRHREIKNRTPLRDITARSLNQ